MKPITLENYKSQILQTIDDLASIGWPETRTQIRTYSGICPHGFALAFNELLDEGAIEPVEIRKGNGQRYAGYKVKRVPLVRKTA